MDKKIEVLEQEILTLRSLVNKYRYDYLTGLKQRLDFEDDFSELFFRKESFSLLVIDLNNLHTINLKFGYIEGDRFIKTTAYQISSKIKGRLYRIGGDEFALLVTDSIDDNELDKIPNCTWAYKEVDYLKHLSTSHIFSDVDKILKEKKSKLKEQVR